MTSNNTRNTKTAAAPEPDDSGLLISLDAMVAALRSAHVEVIAKAARVAPQPVSWSPATITAAASLPVPVELPTRYPAKGPGAQMAGSPAFIAAPKDLGALNQPAAPERRNDPLLAAIRAALLNNWMGSPIHTGASAVDGGILPLPVLLTVLATQPGQQKARKWAQTLTTSGQTCIIAQVANVAGRFVVCRPEGVTLVRDFYAPEANN